MQELLDAYADAREIPPVPDDPAARRAAFDGGHRLRWPPRTRRRAPDAPDLGAPDYGRFLFIHIAALAAVQGERARRADPLLAWVLKREHRDWRIGLTDDDLLPVSPHEALVAQGVTLATLAGRLRGEPDLKALLATAPLARGVEPLQLRAVGDLLARLYPDPSGLGRAPPRPAGRGAGR